MLYTNAIKNHPIPIKFIWNLVGPVILEPEYYFTNTIFNDTLESIEPENIKEAVNEGRLIEMNGTETYVLACDVPLVALMNLFLGRKNDSDFDEIFINIEKREINKN